MTDEIDNKKFHRLFGKDLSMALEATLDVRSKLKFDFDPELFGGNWDLLYRNGDVWRAYYPAVVEGNIAEQENARIRFVPWFSGPEVLHYRLCFRLQPLFSKIFRWLKFGRFGFGEEKPFGFLENRPYINLDFYSLTGAFAPLYAKVKDDRGEFIYFVIEAQMGDYNLSSHAGADEIIKMIKHLNPERTMLVHGETQGRLALKTRLAENGYNNAFIPQDGDVIEI